MLQGFALHCVRKRRHISGRASLSVYYAYAYVHIALLQSNNRISNVIINILMEPNVVLENFIVSYIRDI